MKSRVHSMLTSTGVRLSLLFLALFAVTAVVQVFYVTSVSSRLIQGQTRSAIDEQVTALLGSYERSGISGLVRFVDRASRQPGANLYLLADTAGRIVGGNVRSLQPGILDKPGWALVPFSYQRFGMGERNEFQAIAQVLRLPNGLTLLVGRDLGEPERFRGIVRQALMIALGIMTLGALAIWFFVGRRALRRIDGISLASNSIIAGDLSRRLPVSGSGDEFDRLSGSLNAMLDRITHLDAGVRDISNNVAHDLKTPLTRLRTRAEQALTQGRSTQDLRSALEANITDSDQLIRTFNAILMISRLEAGSTIDNRATVDLATLARDVAELYEPTAEEEHVALTVAADAPVEGEVNRELIAQALSNLIENALRHGKAESGSRIDVAVFRRGFETVLRVADNGQGIPPEQRDRATERFVRLEESRSLPGSGLGLSLAKAIAEAHGGELQLSDNGPGLRAELVIPAGSAKSGKAAQKQEIQKSVRQKQAG